MLENNDIGYKITKIQYTLKCSTNIMTKKKKYNNFS